VGGDHGGDASMKFYGTIFPSFPDPSAIASPYLQAKAMGRTAPLVKAANLISVCSFLVCSVIIGIAVIDSLTAKTAPPRS
jgi:hypothetical protein